MSNVLTFTFKDKRSAIVDSSLFLQDGSKTLDFETDDNGHFDFSRTTQNCENDAAVEFANDWSNQELADLFRVQRLLNAAGASYELERGLTDEGDPWCAFCDGYGEVRIHLCRFDGLYVLDSFSLDAPLQGLDFNGLVSDFLNRTTPKTPVKDTQETKQRVVRLHRNQNVRLHPTALLSALIWTLLLDSGDLILVTEAFKTDGETKVAPDGDRVSPEREENNLLSNTPTQSDLLEQDLENDRSHVPVEQFDNLLYTKEKVPDVQAKEASVHSGFLHLSNTYAIGLSTISIAYGLTTQNFWRQEHNAGLDISTDDTILSEFAAEEAPDTQSQLSLIPLAEYFDALLPSELNEDLTILRDALLATLDSDLTQQFKSLEDVNAKLQNEQSAVDPRIDSLFSFSTEPEEAVNEPLASTKIEGSHDNSHREVTSPDDRSFGEIPSDLVAVFSSIQESSEEFSRIHNQWQTVFEDEYANDIQMYSSFDVSKLSARTSDALFQTVLPEKTSEKESASGQDYVGIQSFDDQAQLFVESFLSRLDSIELLYRGGELILIDLDAFQTEGEQTHAMSWELSDGVIISTIGLRSDFEAHDLIT